jgi:hypothetical protein
MNLYVVSLLQEVLVAALVIDLIKQDSAELVGSRLCRLIVGGVGGVIVILFSFIIIKAP